MKIKRGASLQGLHISMRKVLMQADLVWTLIGDRLEGCTVTSGTDGTHSAGSLHYYGLALDFRTRYFDEDTKREVHKALKEALPEYDVVYETSHIHVENDKLARTMLEELKC